MIYKITEDVERALEGMIDPTYVDVVTGRLEVREVFQLRRKDAVAGCHVVEGSVARGDTARVRRGEEIVADSRVTTLRRFQQDVREVQTGFECGLTIDSFTDFQQGDVIELYHQERET